MCFLDCNITIKHLKTEGLWGSLTRILRLKKSVQSREGIEFVKSSADRAHVLDDVEKTDSLGSVSRCSDKISHKTALNEQNAGHCLDPFKVYCIGRQWPTEDSAVRISFSKVWNLL